MLQKKLSKWEKLKAHTFEILISPKEVTLLTLLNFFLFFSTATAQEAIITAGENALGDGGSLSYSIGQIGYKTITGPTGSFAEGVQQPFEISVVTGTDEGRDINLASASAYPNPAKDFLSLKLNHFDFSSLSYRLYDTSGNLLEIKKIEGNETNIAMLHLATGIYLIKVVQANKEVKTFKIIKN